MKWPVLILLAILPLQWFVVGGVRLHLLAMMVFLAVALATHRARAAVPVLRLTWTFVAADIVLCLLWVAANVYHGIGLRQPVQQLVYLGVFLAVGMTVYQGLRRPDFTETLRWSALVVSLTLVVGLSVSVAVNGVNAAAVFGETIASGDPEILQRELFRAAFAGFGFDETAVSGNFRHEVFGTLLVAMTTSAACVGLRPFGSRGARRLYTASMAVAALLIVVSLSRSVTIALAAWPLLTLLRSVLSMRVTPRALGRGLLGAGVVVAAAISGVLSVVWVRFTQDTGSYEARDNLLGRALDNIAANAVTGGVDTASASSHNFVLDSWLRGGVFAALAAAAMTLLLLGLLVSLALMLHRERPWVLPVAVMLALPIVRLFTAGGGLIPPVSWVGLGIAAGFLAYRSTLAAAPPIAEKTGVHRVGASRRPATVTGDGSRA